MFVLYFTNNVAKSQCWILYYVNLFAIFLKFVVLFDICQPVCKAERQEDNKNDILSAKKKKRSHKRKKSLLHKALTWLRYQLWIQCQWDLC